MPDQGMPKMSRSGMKPMRARPMPASEPSRPACGTIFCTQPPKKEKHELDDADEDHGRHADVPGHHGRVLLGHAPAP